MSRVPEYTIHPIEHWPGARTPASERRRSPFKVIWTRVLDELDLELHHLGARSIKLRLSVRERDLRIDGQLRADARPSDPSVLLEFVAGRLDGEPLLVYRCDTFKYWQDNVLAIARGLNALRLVDRYGVTAKGEQYHGFKSLPSTASTTLTASAAAEIIARFGGKTSSGVLLDAEVARQAIRSAVFQTHPDRNGGRQTEYDQVAAARIALATHHGVSL